MPEVVIKIQAYSYMESRPDPGDSDKTVQVSTVAFRGDEIEISEEEYERGLRFDAFVTEDDTPVESPADDWDDDVMVADLDDDELIDWMNETDPNISEVLRAVGDDPESAQRAADAEKERLGDNARSSLLEKLAKIGD